MGRPGHDLAVLDDAGRLKDEVHEIREALAGQDVVLASGHISPRRRWCCFVRARRRDVARTVVTHGAINLVDMPVSLQKEIAGEGVTSTPTSAAVFEPTVPLERVSAAMQAEGSPRAT